MDNIKQKNNISIFIYYEPGLGEVIKPINREEADALLAASQIKEEIKFETRKAHIIFQLIRGFIYSLVTQDPTKVHWDNVRAALNSIDSKLLKDTSAIDMLARELIDLCRKLMVKLTLPKKLKPLFQKELNKPSTIFPKESGRIPSTIKVIEFADITVEQEALFEQGNMFLWDKIFLDILRGTGKKGKELAAQCEEQFKLKLAKFKMENEDPLGFWFNTTKPNPEQPFHISLALQLLIKAIFEDKAQRYLNFREKNPAALTTNIYVSLNRIQSHSNEVRKTSDQIQIVNNDGVLIGSAAIAAFDPRISNYIFNGAHKLKTVNGHRLMRFLPQKAFQQYTEGKELYNILTFDGAATEIAHALGLKKKQASTDINQMLHTLAHGNWNLPQLTGNLIVLQHYKPSAARNQNQGMEIVLSKPLLPFYTHKEDNALLIPIPKDPPLVHPQQFYAGQYHLQNEILSEFCNQSISLAEDGVIVIPQKLWQKLAMASGLNEKILLKVHDRWIQDGTDGARFLERIDKDCYTLGPEYHKELEFLKDQGLRRKSKSNQAKLAIEKRNSRVKKK